VFAKGDAWLRRGDRLRRDAEGDYDFADRIGDTFRGKGGDLAPHEVAEVISVLPGVAEARVYGVRVCGTDGPVGIAALVIVTGFDLDALCAWLARELPPYARPLWLRLWPAMEGTGTFKHREVERMKEGSDPRRVGEPPSFARAEKGRFVPPDAAFFERLEAAQLRLSPPPHPRAGAPMA